MPPSQLKRLKTSLRDQGITGPQKSKKQKKQQKGRSTNERIERNVALQSIRDSFNPFELRQSSRPAKFQSISHKSAAGTGSGRYKDVLHRPGVTKSAGEEMRRATLLPEMHRRNKVGGLVDRRIGEGDAGMTPEEKAVQRFAREKQRKKGGSLFDLEGSDDDAKGTGLTHGGRQIDELAEDDFGDEVSAGSEEQEDGELLTRKRRRSSVSDGVEDVVSGGEGEEGSQRKKSKKEVMEEVIAKSKLHKYERQKVKEDDDDLREQLDSGMSEMLALLKGGKALAAAHQQPTPPAEDVSSSNGPTMNPDRLKLLEGADRDKVNKEYDARLRQLALDTRAKPSERTKTEEEEAAAEARRLKELEERRMKRMRGEDISDDEPQEQEADAAQRAVEGEEDVADEAAEFGFTNSAAQPEPSEEKLVLDDEDEFAIDEDLIASGSDVDISEASDAESESESDAEVGAEEQRDEDEEDEFVKGILGDQTATGSNQQSVGANSEVKTGLAYTYPCPRSHPELLTLIQDRTISPSDLPTVVQRIRALHHSSLSAANKESMADFSSALVDHIAYMAGQKQSLAVIEQLIRHLHSLSRTYPETIATAFRRHLQAWHERGSPNAGDLVVLTAIGSIYPTSDHFHQVVTPAVTLMARYLGMTAPASPQSLATGAVLVRLCLSYQQLSKRYVPEAVRFTLRALSAKPSISAEQATPHLENVVQMADLWKDKSAFAEIFTPFLPCLTKTGAKKELHHLHILLNQAKLRRRPLELHHHKPLAIKTSIPKFEEGYNPDKHYDPDKDRSEAAKFKKEYKREKKGAVRELRKDANFMAREQLREKREKDAAHAQRERRLIAEIQGEEGHEAREYARVKRLRKGGR